MRTLLLVLLVTAPLFAGCTSSTTEEPQTQVAAPLEVAPQNVTLPFEVKGRLGTYFCTFGSVRHACNGQPGTGELTPLAFEGTLLRLTGNVTLADSLTKAPRVDAYLLHRTPGETAWRFDIETDPSASGASPIAFDWDTSPYAGEEVAIYVFASRAVGTRTVGGASMVLGDPFTLMVEATLSVS